MAYKLDLTCDCKEHCEHCGCKDSPFKSEYVENKRSIDEFIDKKEIFIIDEDETE